MKIAFLVSSLQFGGAERVAVTLCNSWVKQGKQVSLIATYNGDEPSFFSLAPEIDLIYLANSRDCLFGNSGHSFARLLKLRHVLKELRPDIIISFLPSANLLSILASSCMGIPTVICERTDPEFYPQPWIWKLACRHLYRFADVLTVQTENVATKVDRLFHAIRRTEVIPNPLPFEPKAVHLGSLARSKILLSVGRLTEGKQVDHLIVAFAGLPASLSDWQLHIYGDGVKRAELESLVEQLGRKSTIKFFGNTTNPWLLMSESECFAMTSRFEGFPNALLEALAIGLPTVVYDCPSGPAEITESGKIACLLPMNDRAALQSALERLLSDRVLREQLSLKANQSVCSRYHIDSVLAIWQQVIESAISAQADKNNRCIS